MTAALPDPSFVSPADELGAIADAAGLRRVHILAWRDLDDPEAGGSEVHAATVASLWAAAGLDVTLRTSRADGHPRFADRDGYRVVRKSGRYGVFPRSALSGLIRRDGARDALVEIWNGMPFFSPLWAHEPRVVFLHHVHAEMWRMALKPAALAHAGELIEFRLAPLAYRRARIITLSESSKAEIVELLRLPAGNVTVVPPGIGAQFSPGGARSTHPLVVAVGRLVPVKQHGGLIDALVALKRTHPALEAVIVGEGYERPRLEAQVESAGASGWLSLPGRLDDDQLVALYRRAWVVTSNSLREGWGMTLTEAAACATPAVVTDIAGHRDAVLSGRSGLLVDGGGGLVAGLDRLLSDASLRRHLTEGALAHSRRFTWEACARSILQVLADEATRHRAPTR